jgi:LPXTG-motif cell wall-anchored protein
MHDNGWWDKENWYSYFEYWSGWEPFYKNPYYLGGIGVAAIAGTWWFLRRRKR